jgi:uncharacterized protein YutE (UPF0331/DUF86 family)
MVDRGAVESRARRVTPNSKCLSEHVSGGREAYLGNRSLQREVERALEVSIQACIDIGAHLVAVWGLGAADDYADVFERLSRDEELDRDLADRMKEAAGQRNMLVHVYIEIDHAVICDKLSEVGDLRTFARWALDQARD